MKKKDQNGQLLHICCILPFSEHFRCLARILPRPILTCPASTDRVPGKTGTCRSLRLWTDSGNPPGFRWESSRPVPFRRTRPFTGSITRFSAILFPASAQICKNLQISDEMHNVLKPVTDTLSNETKIRGCRKCTCGSPFLL